MMRSVVMLRRLQSNNSAAAASYRRNAAAALFSTTSVYSPTTVEARPDEAGTGGRSSEAGLKVAVFGASGFLGNYVCGELGTSNANESINFWSPCALFFLGDWWIGMGWKSS